MFQAFCWHLLSDESITISRNPRTLVNDINTRIDGLLRQHNKNDFYQEVALKLPTTPENHRKYWTAIVQTMQHLREMNIRSAINSGTDALGQFYETFLKYANDASEMGIVLTPRHITKFAVDIVQVQHTDLIFDPTCGTGGFLVAALDSIRERHYGVKPDVYDAFRNDCLYGIEQADDVFSLALVNMIFRGDGKSRIHNGNCFDNQFIRDGGRVVRERMNSQHGHGIFTRVLMNPPFALDEKESEFVDYALSQMAYGGLLFAVLPNGPITGHGEKRWRRSIIERHTVRAVIRMQDDLFYPTAHKGTYALILEAWRPHKKDDPVFFAVLYDDDRASQKSKLLNKADIRDNMDRLTEDIRAFVSGNYTNIEGIPKESSISALSSDGDCDFAPEAYVASTVSIESSRGCARSLFMVLQAQKVNSPVKLSAPISYKSFRVDEILTIKRGQCPSLKNLKAGSTPVITASGESNGIAGYYAVPEEHLHRNEITVSANGSDANGLAFWHPYWFSATADALICKVKDRFTDVDNPAFILYLCEVISNNEWRFDYFRKCTQSRLVSGCYD